jgi:hypothetical protein
VLKAVRMDEKFDTDNKVIGLFSELLPLFGKSFLPDCYLYPHTSSRTDYVYLESYYSSPTNQSFSFPYSVAPFSKSPSSSEPDPFSEILPDQYPQNHRLSNPYLSPLPPGSQ